MCLYASGTAGFHTLSGGFLRAHRQSVPDTRKAPSHAEGRSPWTKALMDRTTSGFRQKHNGIVRFDQQGVVDQASNGSSSNGVLQGLVIAITGNFDKKRPAVEENIKAQNAVFSGTVHKRVDFLFCDEGALASRTKHVSPCFPPLALLPLLQQDLPFLTTFLPPMLNGVPFLKSTHPPLFLLPMRIRCARQRSLVRK